MSPSNEVMRKLIIDAVQAECVILVVCESNIYLRLDVQDTVLRPKLARMRQRGLLFRARFSWSHD